MDIIFSMLSADKLGGYVRAGVAALLGIVAAKSAWLAPFLTPEIQTAVGVAVSGAVVGAWSHFAKSVAATTKPV